MILTVSLIALIPVVIYVYYKHKHNYWAQKGVPYLEPSFPFGNIGDFVTRKTSILHLLRNIYVETKLRGYKYTGLYLYARRALFITDPVLIKRILTTDFHHFHDRDLYHDEENDPFTGNLVALTGHRWKTLRAKLTPTFTSGKLKMMFGTIVDCATEMKPIFLSHKAAPVEIKDLMSRFTTDVIGSCAFGIYCNSLKDPNTEFSKYSKKAMTQSLKDVMKLALYKNFPRLAKLLKVKVISPEISDFFMDVVKQTVKHREEHNITRNDFMQLLIQLKNGGSLEGEENEGNCGAEFKFGLNQMAAQAFIFFLAGFDSSSTVISFALFEIALNDDIQERIRREISDTLEKYEGKITYEGIMEMEYMERVIFESMRKYPAVPVIQRKCTKKYKMPESNVIIEEETPVFVSIWGLHSDPEYFPNPENFDPDRFNKNVTQSRPEFTYMPFGDGPRICIGLRFGMMQIKIALAYLLSNFKFTINSKTTIPLEFDKNRQAILHPVGGIWLNVTELNKNEYYG